MAADLAQETVRSYMRRMEEAKTGGAGVAIVSASDHQLHRRALRLVEELYNISECDAGYVQMMPSGTKRVRGSSCARETDGIERALASGNLRRDMKAAAREYFEQSDSDESQRSGKSSRRGVSYPVCYM